MRLKEILIVSCSLTAGPTVAANNRQLTRGATPTAMLVVPGSDIGFTPPLQSLFQHCILASARAATSARRRPANDVPWRWTPQTDPEREGPLRLSAMHFRQISIL